MDTKDDMVIIQCYLTRSLLAHTVPGSPAYKQLCSMGINSLLAGTFVLPNVWSEFALYCIRIRMRGGIYGPRELLKAKGYILP